MTAVSRNGVPLPLHARGALKHGYETPFIGLFADNHAAQRFRIVICGISNDHPSVSRYSRPRIVDAGYYHRFGNGILGVFWGGNSSVKLQ